MNSRTAISILERPTKQFCDLNDSDLVVECQQDRKGAITHLLKRHERTVHSIIHRLAPDFADTSDMRQEISIKIWRSISKLRNPFFFKNWLNQIVTNVFYDELRKRSSKFMLVSMDEPFVNEDGIENGTRDIVDYSPQPKENALQKELSGILVNAISSIAAHSRTVFVLRDIEGMSYQEIASITGSELGTVKSRIARARLKIQELVIGYLRPSSCS